MELSDYPRHLARNFLKIIENEDAVHKTDPDHWSVHPIRGKSRRVKVYRRGDLLKCSTDTQRNTDDPCSHILAVLYFEGDFEIHSDKQVYRKSDRGRDYALEERAWKRVPERVPELLAMLLKHLPEQTDEGLGRPRKPLYPQVFQSVMRVWKRSNLRELPGVMQLHQKHNPWGPVSRSTISRFLNHPDTEALLRELLHTTLKPAKDHETILHPDGTGITTNRFTSYFQEKHLKVEERWKHDWNFCLILWTYEYTLIAGADIRSKQFGEAPSIIPLFEKALEVFDIKELGGDKAYDANYLFQWAKERGIDAQFKIRKGPYATPSDSTRKYRVAKIQESQTDPEYYAKRANRKNNAESGNHSFKSLVGDKVYSTSPTAQVNEILCMCIVYNLTRLVVFEETTQTQIVFE